MSNIQNEILFKIFIIYILIFLKLFLSLIKYINYIFITSIQSENYESVNFFFNDRSNF